MKFAFAALVQVSFSQVVADLQSAITKSITRIDSSEDTEVFFDGHRVSQLKARVWSPYMKVSHSVDTGQIKDWRLRRFRNITNLNVTHASILVLAVVEVC